MTLFLTRIPFFFEPNFDTLVKLLDAALCMQAKDFNILQNGKRKTVKPSYEPVIYGEFLKKKVANNIVLRKEEHN